MPRTMETILAVMVPIALSLAGGLAYVAYNNPATYRGSVAPVVARTCLLFMAMTLSWAVSRWSAIQTLSHTSIGWGVIDQVAPGNIPLLIAVLCLAFLILSWLLTFFHKDLP